MGRDAGDAMDIDIDFDVDVDADAEAGRASTGTSTTTTALAHNVPVPDRAHGTETDVHRLLRAWQNERHAPDVLRMEEGVLGRVLDAVRRQVRCCFCCFLWFRLQSCRVEGCFRGSGYSYF